MADKKTNSMKCVFSAKSVNEGFARMCVAAFAAQYDPTVAVLADIKTAVSEAVTNCIVHAYAGREDRESCFVFISCTLHESGRLIIKIKDRGRGISDIRAAMEPLFTTDTEGERSGMGFTVMETFCDKLRVSSTPGKGTTVTLEKKVFT